MKLLHLIIAVSFLISCNNKNDARASAAFSRKSDTLLLEGKFDQAKNAIEKAIQLDPSNCAAYNNRAYLNFKLNKSSNEIISDYKKALSINPSYDQSLFSLANYYFEIKDYKNTIENANIYLSYAGKNHPAESLIQYMYLIRGRSKYMHGECKNAIQDIQTAMKIDSTKAKSFLYLGDCHFCQNSVGEAIKEFSRAIDIDSTYVKAYLARAQCYESSKLPPLLYLAEQDYRSAFKIDFNIEDIYHTNSPIFKKIEQQFKYRNNQKSKHM